jgi:vacuolar-type H+-ATPase subunit H
MTTVEIMKRNAEREAALDLRKPEAEANSERQKAIDRDRELTMEENDLALGVAPKQKSSSSSGAVPGLLTKSSSAIVSALDKFDTSHKATNSRDFDGKPISTYDTKNMSKNVELCTPFRRMCDPRRWSKYLRTDEITYDTVYCHDVVKRYARLLEISSASLLDLPPDIEIWRSVAIYNQLAGIPVFTHQELFAALCSFDFSKQADAKSLSLRSFLPKELKNLVKRRRVIFTCGQADNFIGGEKV